MCMKNNAGMKDKLTVETCNFYIKFEKIFFHSIFLSYPSLIANTHKNKEADTQNSWQVLQS